MRQLLLTQINANDWSYAVLFYLHVKHTCKIKGKIYDKIYIDLRKETFPAIE